jgi:hypothetical protein
MNIAAIALVIVVVLVTVVLVVGVFIWGAVKDGQEDKAVQAELSTRRYTRLGS